MTNRSGRKSLVLAQVTAIEGSALHGRAQAVRRCNSEVEDVIGVWTVAHGRIVIQVGRSEEIEAARFGPRITNTAGF
jgi:hypothetical protein